MQLQEKISLRKVIIEQQKEAVLKNREERAREQSASVIIGDFVEGQLPEELRNIY